MVISHKSLVNSQARGFIALTSVIIISAVIVLLIVGIFRSSVGEMERGKTKEMSGEALSLANTCAEIALNELRKDPDYSVSEEITIDEGGIVCYISEVGIEDGKTVIKTKGEASNHTRRIQVAVESFNPIEIAEWKETE